jgi:hypothetical protein
MSKYAEEKTEFKEAELLIEALKAVGFDVVENHEVAQNLIGYMGDTRKDKANIIIRRHFISVASNDLGFKRNENGTYTAIISDYDRNCGYNNKWLTNLKTEYARAGVMRQARRAGLRFVREEKKQGKIQLKFLKG